MASAQIARLDVKSLKNPHCFDCFEKFAKTSVKNKNAFLEPVKKQRRPCDETVVVSALSSHTMHARTTPPTRDVAILLGSAGGVSGKGSGASPSQDAVNLVRWSLARGFLDPRRDRLVAVHCSELNPLTASGTRVTHELVTPSEFPEWMPPALAHAFGRFAARGGGKGAAAALLESPLAPAEALVRFVSGELRGVAEGRHSARLAAFRAERAPRFARGASAAAARDGTTPHGASSEEPLEPFPVDLWPAEDLVPSRRSLRGDDEATTPAFDLVLVGASDRNEGAFGALRRAAMGSVSRRVLERSPAPVLVVRARDARRASGFGNDAAFAPPRGKLSETASSTARRTDANGHARSRSFPGNWRMLVDEEEEGDGNGIVLSSSGRGTAHETNEANETTESRSESRSGSSRVRDEGGTVRAGPVPSADALVHRIPRVPVCVRETRNVPPVTGNVLCVAHDGGEDGVALVRWTLRTLLRSTDRAVVVVHVAPGHSPAALAAAFGTETNTESTTQSPGLGPVADALLQSDEDVARAIAAFRRERPPPATAPASSVLVVGAGEAPELAETQGPLPSAHDTVTGASSRSRVGNRVAAGLGPFLPPGSAEGSRGFHEKWGLGALLRAASERSADVLVVGSRRLKRRIVSGGAARACARLAPCAALAVPADALAPFRRK